MNARKPLSIGIAGGTGSGKTTVAMAILARAGADQVAFIQHDSYYKDLSDLAPAQRASTNFDHPDSLENELMVKHIQALRAGLAVEVPTYDFTTHMRTKETLRIEPKPIILVEGILIFYEPSMREMFDIKLFVDTDADIRFIRRLQRDIDERGRTTESVIQQYHSTVRPMHLEFVEPSKRYADLIIPEGGYNEVALDVVMARIETRIQQFNLSPTSNVKGT
jgi:uridine kinase